MPVAIAQIAAGRRRERQVLADVEDDLAAAIDRDGRPTPEDKAELVARIVLGAERVGVAGRWGDRAGILPEHHLRFAGGLLIRRKAVQHRREIGIGGRIICADKALVEQRGAGVEFHGIERGGGPLGVGVDELGEGQIGAGHQHHGVGDCAVQALELGCREAIAGQKGIHTGDRLTGDEIGEGEGIGIEIGAALAVHGGAVGPIGLQAPGPAVERIALAAGDRRGIDQSQAGGIVVAEPLHLEGALQQPTGGQAGGPDGCLRGLPHRHDAGTGGIGTGLQLHPALDRIGQRGSRRGSGIRGRWSRQGGRRNLGDQIDGELVEAAKTGGQHTRPIAVAYSRGLLHRQGAGHIEVEPAAGGEGGGEGGAGGAAVEAGFAGGQSGHRQIDRGLILEHRLLVRSAHRLAPADQRCLQHRAIGLLERLRSDAEIGDAHAHAGGGIPGDGDDFLAEVTPVDRVAVGVDPGGLDRGGQRQTGAELLRQSLDRVDRDLGPDQQCALHPCARIGTIEQLQIGDDRIAGPIQGGTVGLLPVGGAAIDSHPVVDRLFTINSRQISLVILVAVGVGVGNQRITRFHPCHQRVALEQILLTSADADRAGMVGEAELRCRAGDDGRVGELRGCGEALATAVEVDGERLAVGIEGGVGHPVLQAPVAIGGVERQLIGLTGGEVHPGVHGAGLGGEIGFLHQVAELHRAGRELQARLAQRRDPGGQGQRQVVEIGGAGLALSDVERLIEIDAADAAAGQVHRRRGRIAGIVAEQRHHLGAQPEAHRHGGIGVRRVVVAGGLVRAEGLTRAALDQALVAGAACHHLHLIKAEQPLLAQAAAAAAAGAD